MDVLKKVFRAGTNSQQQPTSSTEPEVPPSSSAAAAIAIQPRALPAGIIITSPSRSPADRIVGSGMRGIAYSSISIATSQMKQFLPVRMDLEKMFLLPMQ
jgi:hypothetical protein